MNQLKLATTKAKEGLFDEAIEILLFAYQSGISSEADILKLKSKSIEVGIPYQTIINALIHNYATNKLKLTI